MYIQVNVIAVFYYFSLSLSLCLGRVSDTLISRDGKIPYG